MGSIQNKFRAALRLEQLEDRLVPATLVPDPTVDLTTRGSIGSINDAIFRQFDAQPTGTGYIDSFVRLQAQGAKTTVQHGFNTDGALQFDENKSRQFTRSLQLGDVPEVTIGGVKYREFLLDINQKASQPFLSLDELRIFVGGQGDLTGYDTSTNQLAGLDAVYDLDAGSDNWVKLNVRLNQGSGKGDMLMYVPSSLFGDAGPESYLYLYSKFGVTITANAGFEEWAVASSSLTKDAGSITGTVLDCHGNVMSGVVLFLDANNNGVHDDDEVYTTTNENGEYWFENLATGLGDLSIYRVREIVPEGFTLEDFPPDIFLDDDDPTVVVNFVNIGEDCGETPPGEEEEEPPTGGEEEEEPPPS